MNGEEIATSNKAAMCRPDDEDFAGLSLRPITAGTLSLCSLAKNEVVSADAPESPEIFDIMSFFYIHCRTPAEVRAALFDNSEGKDEKGRSVAFIGKVVEWADETLPANILEEGLEKMAAMLEEAFAGVVEPVEADPDAKKKE